MDDTAIKQNLGCVGDLLKDLQGHIEFIVVVAGEGCHPGFDFLPVYQQLKAIWGAVERTCFRDMTSDFHLFTRQYGVVKPQLTLTLPLLHFVFRNQSTLRGVVCSFFNGSMDGLGTDYGRLTM